MPEGWMSERAEWRKPVMIVEDDEDTREVLGEVLRAEGYDVVLVESAEGCLALLAGGLRPSLVLTDLRLGYMGGEELARALRRDPVYEDTPVVIMTAAPYGGPGPVLRKPFGIEDLLALMPRGVVKAKMPPSRVGEDPRGLEAVA
jgi:Response regulator receiver domain